MKSYNIFQFAKLARRVPRRIAKAKEDIERLKLFGEPARKLVLARTRDLIGLEAKGRTLKQVRNYQAAIAAKPFRDSRPKKLQAWEALKNHLATRPLAEAA